MKTILVDYKSINSRFDELSLCLGYFDAVHKGHQELIKYARKNAKYTLGLITFDKPISTFVKNGKSSEVITSLDDRFKIISKLGVDYYYVFKIDENFTNLNEEEFINLLKKMNVKEIFIGSDFKYGKNNCGTIYSLQDNFEVHIVDLVKEGKDKISSKNIKELIKNGKVEEASNLLGRNYCISGSIISGNQIGTKIGFPTLNLKLFDNYVLPKFGVYKVICYVDNVPHVGIANVGVRPTISDDNVPNVEVHLKDSNLNIFGDVVSVEFLKFIREEKKFSSLEELKKQIAEDVEGIF